MDIDTEVQRLRAAHPGALKEVSRDEARGMAWIETDPAHIVAVAKCLRDDAATRYTLLVDLTCVDRPEDPLRFHLIYIFYSVDRKRRLCVRVRVAEGAACPTLSAVFPCAEWAEREIMDLFGVPFEGHPDPRKLLLPDDWEGFPLRKDYPLVGLEPVILYNDVKDIL